MSENTSILTTFNTPFGRFKFLRLLFEVTVAPEIFHGTFVEIFEGIQGIKIYIDDLIIHAKTESEHDEILQKVFDTAREKGVKFNKNKCKFKVQEVKYIGHVLTSEGIKMDPGKNEAIKQIQVQ